MLKYKNNKYEIGLDEAGRGPLIGRVYAGAMIWDVDIDNDLIRDSKKLTKPKRATALKWIHANIKYWGVGFATENEIDNINILNATKLAMDRAIGDLKTKYNKPITDLLIDGSGWENKFKTSCYTVESVVKGDSLYYSIAGASIIAKEYHDTYIKELVLHDPTLDTKYGLLSNMGYPTKKHFEGITKYGITQYHRTSFKLNKFLNGNIIIN